MAIGKTNFKGPQFVRCFAPLLKALHDLGGSARPNEAEDAIAQALKLTQQDRDEEMKSGQSRFSNQVAWAKFYLSKAGLIESSARGVWSLT